MNSIEAMKSGRWHNGFMPEIAEALRPARDLCFAYNNLNPNREAERAELIRRLLGHIGEPFCIHSPFHCDFGTQISIGTHFMSNFNFTVLDEGEVTIGDRVFVGPNVSIYTVVHALTPAQRNAGIMRSKPVRIGSDVWIGGNVVILPGVTIGDGAVIGAGSVVTRDIPPGVLAVGNPCRVVREITDADVVTDIAM